MSACSGARRSTGRWYGTVIGETVVQSPLGGTKVAWDGHPIAPKIGRSTQRFLLTAPGGDIRAEIDRLVSLGATSRSIGDDGSAELADVEGNEFLVRPA